MKRYSLLFAFSLFLIACQSEPDTSNTTDSTNAEAAVAMDMASSQAAKFTPPVVLETKESTEPDQATAATSSVNSKEIQTKRIVQGNMSIETTALADSRNWVDSLSRKYKAWYAGQSQMDEPARKSISLNIRIPAAQFEAFVTELEQGKVGKVLNKSVNSEDITAAYVDNESRIASEQAYLQRYRDMLKKANSVKEMLEIEERIRLLTEEMESRLGQKKMWDRQVSYSSLQLELYELKPYVYPGDAPLSLFQRIKASWYQGGQYLVGLFLTIISWWPFLLAFAGLYWLWKRKRK